MGYTEPRCHPTHVLYKPPTILLFNTKSAFHGQNQEREKNCDYWIKKFSGRKIFATENNNIVNKFQSCGKWKVLSKEKEKKWLLRISQNYTYCRKITWADAVEKWSGSSAINYFSKICIFLFVLLHSYFWLWNFHLSKTPQNLNQIVTFCSWTNNSLRSSFERTFERACKNWLQSFDNQLQERLVNNYIKIVSFKKIRFINQWNNRIR